VLRYEIDRFQRAILKR